MTSQNHWGAFKDSLARWYLEFPAAMWSRWGELLAFADAVFDVGSREQVLIVDEIPSPEMRAESLFGEILPATLVSVFGQSGIEDRIVRDLRPEILSLRHGLRPTSVPHANAVSVSGPLFIDHEGPVEASISIDTDIWFPRVVGIHDDSDDGPIKWYDNSALAVRHTPRLNRFLGIVRERAAILDAKWSYDASHNKNYTDMVNEDGIILK